MRLPFLALVFISFFGSAAASAGGITRMSGHVPVEAISRAHHVGRKKGTDQIQLAISLQLKDAAGLTSFVNRVNDPSDPLYRQFLTPNQVAATFALSPQDVNQVAQYFVAQGLNVTQVHPNNLIIDVQDTVTNIENAFQTEIHEYVTADGRTVYASISDPAVSNQIIPKLNGIVGLHSFGHWKPHAHKGVLAIAPKADSSHASVADFMVPARIKTVYNLNSLTQTGTGETLALFELDGYLTADITEYITYFSLPAPTLTVVAVDGANYSTPGSGAGEVTLDIELAITIAPGLAGIRVYEGPNTSAGVIDTYSKIQTEDLAKEVSSSWGQSENEMPTSGADTMSAENIVFTAMAAQGQSVFAAAGDNGAYDDSYNGINSLEIDDPASQPYVTAVGGTSLTWNATTSAWISETSWNTKTFSGTYGQSNYVASEGGGGGISTEWANTTVPFQASLATLANKGSTTFRMVPDVSLDADPNTGYPIYVTADSGGGWNLYGGTSCAAPLWAAFTALVNQGLVAGFHGRLGLANTVLYAIGKGASYSTSFHDIADGSTNLYYPAVTGYDLSTGWGTFNGAGLFTALTTVPAAPIGLVLTPGVLTNNLSWSASAGAYTYTINRSATGCAGFSVLASGVIVNTYNDNGLSTGTTYCYNITATNSLGTSAASANVSYTFPAPPSAPTNLTATAAP